MILDGQILVISKYHHTVLKLMGNINFCIKAICIWSNLQSCRQKVKFHHFRASELKEVLITFFLNSITNRTSTCVYKLSISIRAKSIQDASPRFCSAVRELYAAINKVMIRYTVNI